MKMLYKNGCSGAEIGIIQSNLKMLGYDPNVIDCIFGENTEIAVKEFQGANGLVIDGIAGLNTYNCLLRFQETHDLIVDGIVGSHTCEALFHNNFSYSSSSSSNFDISDKQLQHFVFQKYPRGY
jgi:peptidoglycan hydrolase-like protein with peptidoglycan-binding domain